MPLATAEPRELRLTFAYCGNPIDAIIRQAGFPMSDQEASAILERIDHEMDSVAESAAAAAIEKRIDGLIELVRIAHQSPSRDRPEASKWPRRLSMC